MIIEKTQKTLILFRFTLRFKMETVKIHVLYFDLDFIISSDYICIYFKYDLANLTCTSIERNLTVASSYFYNRSVRFCLLKDLLNF